MISSKFSKPLIIDDEEREKRAEEFVNLSVDQISKKRTLSEKSKKQKTKTVYLRAPESLWEDIHEIAALTGLSMNAVCLELLRPAIKRKLKELKEI